MTKNAASRHSESLAVSNKINHHTVIRVSGDSEDDPNSYRSFIFKGHRVAIVNTSRAKLVMRKVIEEEDKKYGIAIERAIQAAR